MGACDSIFNDKKKIIPKEDADNRPKNDVGNLNPASINNTTTNNGINQTNLSQMTMEVSQHYEPPSRPVVYKYVNEYETNGLQRSVAKASLRELDKEIH